MAKSEPLVGDVASEAGSEGGRNRSGYRSQGTIYSQLADKLFAGQGLFWYLPGSDQDAQGYG